MRTAPSSVALLLLALAGCSSAGGVPARAGLDPVEVSTAPREQTEDQQVLHALNRLAFGPRPGDVARVHAMGVDAWIAQQLAPATVPDARAEAFADRFALIRGTGAELVDRSPPPFVARQQLQQRLGANVAPSADDSARFRDLQLAQRQMTAQLVAARVAQAVLSERQLQEVMTDFWLNHFTVFIGKNPYMRFYLPAYERHVIRPRALGNFRDLLGAVAHSPAMLVYLDNAQSMVDSNRTSLLEARARRPGLLRGAAVRRRNGLNENYGRELLELHTLGVDGGYTQADVINVARALTGWTVDQPRQGGGFIFRPAMHDADPKVVLGRTLPGGRGEEDGEEVLDLLAAHPSTARFIATKLARRLVSDTPPAALVERAAHAFTRTKGDIAATVRVIVTSPEFFSRAAWRAKVKSPFEVVVSAARALGADGDSTARTALAIGQLGQPLWGHQAPNGYPEQGHEWMNTGAILNRINFGLALGASRLPGVAAAQWEPARALQRAPREQQVAAVVDALFGGDVSTDTRAILLSGDHPFLSRAQAQAATEAPMANPDDLIPREDAGVAAQATMPPAAPVGNPPGAPGARAGAASFLFRRLPPLTGFAQVVGLALGAPEFQRR